MAPIIKKGSFISVLILTAIVCASFLFMFFTAREESGTMDELAHIPAGYGYVRYFDYRLNPEHPPLVKALSSIPLLFLDIHFPTEHKSWDRDVNGQWDAGIAFLYHSGNDADEIIFWARIVPILLTLISIFIIFFWARELMGAWWALIPAALFGLSPTILAHGHYVTTDIGATLGVLIGIFSFSSFLTFPSRKKFWIAGICFGIAELLKFSNVLLIPLYIVLTLVSFSAEWYRNKENKLYRPMKNLWSYGKSLIGIFLIGIIAIYAVYFLFTLHYPLDRQLHDTTVLLEGFSPPFLKDLNIFLAGNTIFRPLGEYLLGILMVIQRSSGGNTGYFLGEVTNVGWRHYFPVIFATKETLPGLLLIGFGIVAGMWSIFFSAKQKMRIKRAAEYIGTHIPEFSMTAFILLYWIWSLNSTLNIGMRHLLPVIPLMYILSANSIKIFIESRSDWKIGKYIRGILISGFIIGAGIQSFASYPYFLSFFNVFGGGTVYGYNIATDSNYDWGQDLKRLALWKKEMEARGIIVEKIAVDYFGAGDPEFYLGKNHVERWWGSRGNPKEEDIEWIAISVNSLTQAFAKETEGFQMKEEQRYEWLRELRDGTAFGTANIPSPDFRAGTSIFIYHL